MTKLSTANAHACFKTALTCEWVCAEPQRRPAVSEEAAAALDQEAAHNNAASQAGLCRHSI